MNSTDINIFSMDVQTFTSTLNNIIGVFNKTTFEVYLIMISY